MKTYINYFIIIPYCFLIEAMKFYMQKMHFNTCTYNIYRIICNMDLYFEFSLIKFQLYNKLLKV